MSFKQDSAAEAAFQSGACKPDVMIIGDRPEVLCEDVHCEVAQQRMWLGFLWIARSPLFLCENPLWLEVEVFLNAPRS